MLKRRGEEEEATEEVNKIKIYTDDEVLQNINDLIQFVVDLNLPSILEHLYSTKDSIQKTKITKKVETFFFVRSLGEKKNLKSLFCNFLFCFGSV